MTKICFRIDRGGSIIKKVGYCKELIVRVTVKINKGGYYSASFIPYEFYKSQYWIRTVGRRPPEMVCIRTYGPVVDRMSYGILLDSVEGFVSWM